MAAVRDGRWFWWLLACCMALLFADSAGLGPFGRETGGERDRAEVEVLGDSLERELPATSSPPAPTTPTTLSEADALERLDGLDPETLDALEEIKGVDPADLPPATTAP